MIARYTKPVLTVIAFALLVLAIQRTIRPAKAEIRDVPLVGLCGVASYCPTFTGAVDWNNSHDGNLKVGQWTVQLWGIDIAGAAEPNAAAREELKKIIGDKRVVCRPEEWIERRLVAQCLTVAPTPAERIDVGAEMVRRGFALDCKSYSLGEYRNLEPPGARKRLFKKRIAIRRAKIIRVSSSAIR